MLAEIASSDLIELRAQAESNAVRCPDPAAAQSECWQRLDSVRAEGDSLGGVVVIIAEGVPAGLGEPVFDKLDADLAKALMSIGAVKAVEIGAGRECAGMRGSEMNDPLLWREGKVDFREQQRRRHFGRHLHRRAHRLHHFRQAHAFHRKAAEHG